MTGEKYGKPQEFSAFFYSFFYITGLQGARNFRRIFRFFGGLFCRVFRKIRLWWRVKFVFKNRHFWKNLGAMFCAVPGAFEEIFANRKTAKGGIFSSFAKVWRRGVNHYRDELTTLWVVIGPIVAMTVLVITLSAWAQVRFCLSLYYRGEDLGYISSEDTYEQAAAMAKARVVNVDDSFSVEAVPTIAITLQKDKTVLSEGELCDAILRTAGDAITDAAGLYIDGKFVGSMASESELDALLEEIKDGYYDKNDSAQRAEFVQKVETVAGLFPSQTVVSHDIIKSMLLADSVVEKTYTVQPGDTLGKIAYVNNMTLTELRSMNPAYASTDMVKIGDSLVVQRPEQYLQVKVIKTIAYTETIDYSTQYENNNDKPITYSAVKVKGEEGSQDIVADVTYIDGIETERTIVSTTVTKEPVTKVVERGTKKVTAPNGQEAVIGDGITTGSMAWPVPICHNTSRGFGYGHSGLDICNGPVSVRNKPACAADGGTVILAGWNGGYGYCVKIQHSNGLVTLYGHLNSISVVNGQTVSQGQQIGLIGSTGQASGPHLHFEVIRGGVRVNPRNYVSP